MHYTRAQLFAAASIFVGIAIAALAFSLWNTIVRASAELSSSTVEVIRRESDQMLGLPLRVTGRIEAREGRLHVHTTVRNSDWRWIVIHPPSCGTSLMAENAEKVFRRTYVAGDCRAVILFPGEAKTTVSEFSLSPEIDRYKFFLVMRDDLTERDIYVSATLVVPQKR